jgi:hypothetical protein
MYRIDRFASLDPVLRIELASISLNDSRLEKRVKLTCWSTYQLRWVPRFSASVLRWCTLKCQSM